MPDMKELEKILIKNKNVTFGINHLRGIIKNVSQTTSFGLLSDSEDSILNIMKLLNTLSFINENKTLGMITNAWMYNIITLKDKIATENAHVWIQIFNLLHDMYKESYGFTDESGLLIGPITLSCHLRKCSPSEIKKRKYSNILVKRLNDFHDYTTRNNINDHTSEKFLGAYYQKFPDRPESGLWEVFVPQIIRNKYRLKENFFEEMNHLLIKSKELRQEMLTPGTSTIYISLLVILLFPATLSKDIIVYRKDTTMKTDNIFYTDGFFSTSLSYESVEEFQEGAKKSRIIRITIPRGTKFLPTLGIDRKEREITLMPGTTLVRESGACQVEKYRKGYAHIFCDYKVTETKALSDESQKQLFLYMVRSYWRTQNKEYYFPYDIEMTDNILNGILEDIRS